MDYKDIDKHISEALPLQMPKWVMFGDSLTQRAWDKGGVGAALQSSYARQLDIVCRGYSGYNTEWALYVLPHLVNIEGPVKIFSIWLGANDACLESNRQHVSIPRFKSNLKYMLDLLKVKYPETTLILFTPPPVSESGRINGCNEKFGYDPARVPDRLVKITKQYAEAVVQVGQDERVHVFDIYNAVENEAIALGNGDREKGLEKLLCDGLHFTPQGYNFVHHVTLKAMKEQLSHLLPEQLERFFPWHDEINADDPSSNFPPEPNSLIFSQYVPNTQAKATKQINHAEALKN